MYEMNMLSWIFEIQMQSHLVSDINCNIVHLQCPISLQGMTTNFRFMFRVGNTKVTFEVLQEGMKPCVCSFFEGFLFSF